MSSRIVLALAAALSSGGCAVYRTELTSIPTFSLGTPALYECPRAGGHYAPPSGAGLCFSIHGIRIEVEAYNAQPVAGAFGPFPLIPFFCPKSTSTRPLTVGLGFKTDQPYTFAAWDVSLQTEQGETVRVSGVSANVRDGRSIKKVAIERRDAEALTTGAHVSNRFFLTFAKHVPPEQKFALTVRLVAPDGVDVQIPIRFKRGKFSYLGTIP
jgi:hypothetical protein